jgi:hypothetical protein
MNIVIEPIPANPGYTATVSGGDPECNPTGFGMTRMAAALDLARSMLDAKDNHIALCLAIAAVLRVELEDARSENGRTFTSINAGYLRAIAQIEGIW